MGLGSFLRRIPPPLLAGSSALVSALWIAICAGAPEFIWRGLRIALKHLNSTALLSALLIGVVLAFFVEPILDRLRDLLRVSRHKEPAHSGSRSLLYSAGVSLAFALVSVSLHEAMSAFVSNGDAGLNAGLALAAEWAIVPFCIAVAWQGATSSAASSTDWHSRRGLFGRYRMVVWLDSPDSNRDGRAMPPHSISRLPADI